MGCRHRDRRLETKRSRGYLNCGVVVLLACLLAACSTRGSTSSVPTTVPAAKGWNVVASPGVGQEGALGAVTVLSASDAWAVGQYEGPDSAQHPLAEHWDGAQWSVVASPSPGSVYNILQGVSGDASGDIWAVGQQSSSTHTDQPLIERWDGGSWKASPAAPIDPASGGLGGVAAISPSDVWAVGSITRTNANNQPGTDPLIEHWDGSHWSVVTGASLPASPSGYDQDSLDAVAAISATDVWAVGRALLPPGPSPLIEHWDGHAWRMMDGSPFPNASFVVLTGISAVAANDVWAVGTGLPTWIGGCGFFNAMLVEHWDGTRWTRVSAAEPTSTSPSTGLTSVSAAASNDVWIAGGTGVESGRTQAYAPLIEHWDGTRWSTVAAPNARLTQGFAGIAARPGLALAVGQNVDRNGPGATHIERWSGGQWSVVVSPSPGTLANALSAVAASSSQDVWAVGNSSSGTLTEHWNGSSWRVVPSPNGTPVDNALYGVSAAAPNDAWAVGGVIEHWDGTQWSLVTGAQSSGLFAVAAVSARDV